MNKIFLSLVLTLFVQIIIGQDKIYNLNSDVLNCKVTKIESDAIMFHYPNEDLVNEISPNVVEKIVFESGREQAFSTKIIINSEKDWEKVKFTKSELSIRGLVDKGEIFAKAKAAMGRDVGKKQKKAMERLKKEAAKKGAHIILIISEATTTYRGAPSVGVSAVCYGYE